MSFVQREVSRFLGKPINLYEIVYGGDVELVHRFCDQRDIVTTSDGREFKPIPIKRGDITLSGTNDKGTFELSAPITCPIAELFRVSAPASIVHLTIYTGHADDPDREFRPDYVGRIRSATWQGSTVTFTVDSASSSLQRNGVRWTWTYTCRHVLYGEDCTVNKTLYTRTAQILDANGATLTLGGNWRIPGHQYAGGIMDWRAPDRQLHRRSITLQVGEALQVAGVFPGIKIGDPVTVAPGCAHDLDACLLFKNSPNYGASPWIPSKNPVGRRSFWY